jgi:hypothetical protein
VNSRFHCGHLQALRPNRCFKRTFNIAPDSVAQQPDRHASVCSPNRPRRVSPHPVHTASARPPLPPIPTHRTGEGDPPAECDPTSCRAGGGHPTLGTMRENCS